MMKDYLAHRPAVFVTTLFSLGILFANLIYLPVYFLGGCIFLFVFLTFLLSKSKNILIGFAGLFFFMGAVSLTYWKNKTIKHEIRLFFPLQAVSVIGHVVEPPKTGSRQFIAEIEQLNIDNYQKKIQQKFLITLLNPVTGLLPGDSIYLENVDVADISPPRNPGQFNFSKFLKKHGVIGEISATEVSKFKGQSRSKTFNLSRLTFQIRERFSIKIRSLLPEKESNFLMAILLGKKTEIQSNLLMDFQNTGVAHVLAVSGLHVGFVVFILYILISFLPVSFRWHNLITIIFLIFYVLLTGSKPPVVRASLVVSIYLFGTILERKQDLYNSVFVAAFIILIFQPQQLFWVNFQFSFIAVLSILFFYERLKYIEDLIVHRIKKKKYSKLIKRSFVTPFFISISAQLGTMPLMAIYFNKIPIVSFFLNIIVIPLVGLIVALGFTLFIFVFLALPFTPYIANLLLYFIKLLIGIVHFSANFSFSYFLVPQMSTLVLLIYILSILMVFTLKGENYNFVKNPIFSLIIVLFMWIIIPKTYALELIMVDVGQGESSLIRTPDNHILLFDSGPVNERFDSGKDAILPVLMNWGKLKIDRVFISHPHADHIGGLFYLLNKIKIDSVFLPNLQVNYFLHDSLKKKIKERGVPIRYLKRGDHLKVGKETKIYTLSPSEKLLVFPEGKISDKQLNNISLVTLVRVKNQSILFTGDAEWDVEKNLTHWRSFLKSSILKVGHHGSSTSTSIGFLSLVRPDIGLISVSRNNRHNHPSKTVLAKLRDYSVNCFRTDEKGAIWLKYRHQNWEFVNWK